MKSERQIKRWINLLKKLGYDYRWGKVGWWDNQLIAIDPETKEEIPIAVTGVNKYRSAYIIPASELVATEEVFDELRYINRCENAGPDDPFCDEIWGVKITKSGNHYKPELLLGEAWLLYKYWRNQFGYDV